MAMMINTKDELFLRIDHIRDNIISYVEMIRSDMKLLRTEFQNVIPPKTLEDIEKIDETCLQIKHKVSTMLVREKITAETGDHGVYLLRVRHDMHNSINIIMGYTEIALMEFQKQNQEAIVKKFTQIHSLIQNILTLTNDIKLAQPDTPELPNIIDFDLDIELPEYTQFKEKFEVLVVDDIKENTHILQQYLQFMGIMKVTIANDGVEAMQKIKKGKIDLVLLDLDMPRMSGREVLLKLKDVIHQERLVVIVISGYDSMEKNIECIKLGAVDLITKPFNKDLLRVRINTLIEKKRVKYKEVMYQLRMTKIMGLLKRGYYLLYILMMLGKL